MRAGKASVAAVAGATVGLAAVAWLLFAPQPPQPGPEPTPDAGAVLQGEVGAASSIAPRREPALRVHLAIPANEGLRPAPSASIALWPMQPRWLPPRCTCPAPPVDDDGDEPDDADARAARAVEELVPDAGPPQPSDYLEPLLHGTLADPDCDCPGVLDAMPTAPAPLPDVSSAAAQAYAGADGVAELRGLHEPWYLARVSWLDGSASWVAVPGSGELSLHKLSHFTAVAVDSDTEEQVAGAQLRAALVVPFGPAAVKPLGGGRFDVDGTTGEPLVLHATADSWQPADELEYATDEGDEVELSLESACILSGRVMYRGEPAAGATVELRDEGRRATTGADGRFTFAGLTCVAPSEADDGDGSDFEDDPSGVEAHLGALSGRGALVRKGSARRMTTEIHLAPQATLDVHVVDERGPVSGASVTATSFDELRRRPAMVASTDADGRAHLGGFDPETYSVGVEAPGHAPVEEMTTLLASERSALEVKLVSGADLEGVVVDPSGAPVARVDLDAYAPREENTPELHRSWLAATWTARTDARGHFTLRGVPDGALQLRATPPENGGLSPVKETVQLPLQEPLVVHLTLPGKLEVRVLQQGAPVPGVLVNVAQLASPAEKIIRLPRPGWLMRYQLYRSSRINAPGTPNRSPAETDAQGLAQFTGLAPGSYQVDVARGGMVAVSASAEVQASAQDHVDVELPRPGSIAGTVVNAAGAPVPGAKVEATLSRERGEPFVGRSAPLEASTDGAGRFALDELDASRSYLLVARAPEGVSLPVKLAPGAPDATLTLEPRLHVHGRVLLPNGQPASTFRVQGHDFSGPDGQLALDLDPGQTMVELQGPFLATWIRLPSAGPDVDLGDIATSDGAILEGTVRSPAGEPAKMEVCCTEHSAGDGPDLFLAQTDADGHFFLHARPGTLVCHGLATNDVGWLVKQTVELPAAGAHVDFVTRGDFR